MPNYKEKLTYPLSDEDFIKGMKQGKFIKSPEHDGFIAFLHYSCARVTEGLLITRAQFRLTPNILYCNIVIRDLPEIREYLAKQSWVKKQEQDIVDVWFDNYDFGKRLKHSQKTDPIPIHLDLPYVNCIVDSFIQRKPDERVWPYCRKTGYNIVKRVFKYPHYHRLSRITWFFMPHPEIGRPQGFSIAEVHSWTGLSLKALDYYLGLVAIGKMGEAMTAKSLAK